jgi:ribose transport system substrate-binding protein
MAVPYEFNMGYQAVVSAVRKLKNPVAEMKNHRIGFSIITKENLFDEENQKLLFPIVQ